MKMLFDFFPVIVLFTTYLITKSDPALEPHAFTWGAYAFTASAWLLVIFSLITGRKVEQLHWFTAILASIATAIILLTGDSFLFKFKSTIINWLVAAFMIATIFFGQKTFVERIMGEQIEAPSSAWRQLTWVIGICFILLGAVNAYIAITQSDNTWVYFKFISSGVLMVIMFIAGGKILWPYIKEQQEQLEAEAKLKSDNQE